MSKFCEMCGAKIPADAVFCDECGARQTPQAAAAASRPEADPPPAAPNRRVLLLGAVSLILAVVALLVMGSSWAVGLVLALAGAAVGGVGLASSPEKKCLPLAGLALSGVVILIFIVRLIF